MKLSKSLYAPLWVAGCLATVSASADVERRFDQLSNMTEVSAGRPRSPASGNLEPVFFATVEGKTAKTPPPFIRIAFTYNSSKWTYLNCHEIALLADGAAVPVGRSNHVGSIGSKGVHEEMIATLPWRSAERLAAAEKIDAIICRTQIPFEAIDLANLRDVVKASTPPQ